MPLQYPFHVSSSTTSERRSSEAWDGNAVHWRGRASYQLPDDLIRYQEIINERRPQWVIETGGGEGTTTYLQDVCGLLNRGFVVAIGENSLTKVPELMGSVMAVLDSDVYSVEHMRKEIALYAPLVTQGQVLVVCHTDRADWGAGPALAEYRANNPGTFEEVPGPPHTLCTYLVRL